MKNKLNLGCGYHILNGWINLDCIKNKGKKPDDSNYTKINRKCCFFGRKIFHIRENSGNLTRRGFLCEHYY